jgi:predicted nuclease of predicted toxin-antitoxin system
LKLLFDANLAPALAKRGSGAFPFSAHVRDFGVRSDHAICDIAAAQEFTIISKGADFYHLSMLHGAPPKVVWLRVGHAGTRTIANVLTQNAQRIEDFCSDSEAALTIPAFV